MSDADYRAISRIKGLYCDTIDRIVRDQQPGDAALLASLWTEDAVFDFTEIDGNIYRGREAIVALFTGFHVENVEWMWHAVSSEVIDVNGDTAQGRWTLHAQGLSKERTSDAPNHVYGRYIDEFRKESGVWRQSKLFFLNETKGG